MSFIASDTRHPKACEVAIAHGFTNTTRNLAVLLGMAPTRRALMTDWWEWFLLIVGVWFGVVAVAFAIYLLVSPPR